MRKERGQAGLIQGGENDRCPTLLENLGTCRYHASKKRFYLLVSLTITLPDPTPEDLPDVVGVDVGVR